MSILFKNLRLIKPEGVQSPTTFIFQNNSLKKYREGDDLKIEKEIDGTNLYLSSGWTDLRCGAGDPGLEYKESIESLCASLQFSGFSRGVLLPNTEPAIQSKNDVDYVLSKAKKTLVDLVIQGAVTKDTKGEELTEILDMHFQSGVSIFGDGTQPVFNSDRYMKLLQYLQRFNGTLFDYAYDPLIAIFGKMHEGEVSTNLGLKGIPNISEDIAVQRNLEILRYTGGKVHFQTVSTRKAVDLIRMAKKEGLHVTADISIYQLIFSERDLVSFDPEYKVMPPFRGEDDRAALIEGLKDGTIDALVSNHQPQDYDSKFMEFDLASFGMSGLATFLPALVSLSQELGWGLLIEKITNGPKTVLGDTESESWTIFDPSEKWMYDRKSNPSLSSNSPWFGKELQGKVKFVIQKGKLLQFDE